MLVGALKMTKEKLKNLTEIKMKTENDFYFK